MYGYGPPAAYYAHTSYSYQESPPIWSTPKGIQMGKGGSFEMGKDGPLGGGAIGAGGPLGGSVVDLPIQSAMSKAIGDGMDKPSLNPSTKREEEMQMELAKLRTQNELLKIKYERDMNEYENRLLDIKFDMMTKSASKKKSKSENLSSSVSTDTALASASKDTVTAVASSGSKDTFTGDTLDISSISKDDVSSNSKETNAKDADEDGGDLKSSVIEGESDELKSSFVEESIKPQEEEPLVKPKGVSRFDTPTSTIQSRRKSGVDNNASKESKDSTISKDSVGGASKDSTKTDSFLDKHDARNLARQNANLLKIIDQMTTKIQEDAKKAAKVARLSETQPPYVLDVQIKQLEEELLEIQTIISQRDSLLSQRDSCISKHESTISKQETTIADNRSLISKHEKTIADQATMISKHEKTIKGLESTVRRLEATIKEQEQNPEILMKENTIGRSTEHPIIGKGKSGTHGIDYATGFLVKGAKGTWKGSCAPLDTDTQAAYCIIRAGKGGKPSIFKGEKKAAVAVAAGLYNKALLKGTQPSATYEPTQAHKGDKPTKGKKDPYNTGTVAEKKMGKAAVKGLSADKGTMSTDKGATSTKGSSRYNEAMLEFQWMGKIWEDKKEKWEREEREREERKSRSKESMKSKDSSTSEAIKEGDKKATQAENIERENIAHMQEGKSIPNGNENILPVVCEENVEDSEREAKTPEVEQVPQRNADGKEHQPNTEADTSISAWTQAWNYYYHFANDYYSSKNSNEGSEYPSNEEYFADSEELNSV